MITLNKVIAILNGVAAGLLLTSIIQVALQGHIAVVPIVYTLLFLVNAVIVYREQRVF